MKELILEAGQACPYGSACIYNKNWECQGAHGTRTVTFTCNIVATRESGGEFRNPLDETGKMEVIID
jgi:hypothetical protein